jgi:CO/xanthine dehydrogenase Mo-binding subunit
VTELPKSLTDNPLLATWIGFEEGGRVRLATGKVEIGQGVLTALAQIAAEELDVAPERLRIVSGETPTSPSEGFTSGSNSVAVSGSAIRLACAEVRALFLAHVAHRLACPVEALTIEDGSFLRAGRPIGQDYWSLAGQVDLSRQATGAAAPKRPADHRIVGRSLPRLDLADKVRGAAFIHDLAPANVLHARMLRRPWPQARLAALDEAALRRAAGAPIGILRAGDLVAFTADDETAAMRAAEAARTLAVWDGGTKPPSQAGEPDWLKRQDARDRVVETGAAAGAAGNRVVEATFSRPFLTYGSIGPSCALAQYRDGKLEVWTHSQGVFELRKWLAHTLAIEEARITVFHRQGAGCYGHNSADDAAFDAAFVAMRVPNRTVRVQWSREDEFSAAPLGSAMVVGLRAVLDANSRPADWTIEIWSPVHAQRPGMNGSANFVGAQALPDAPPPPAEINDVADAAGGGATRNGQALYDLPRHTLVHHLLPRVPVRTSSLRGLGAFANVFAIESFMDELAETAGEDPVAYRLSLTSDPRAREVIETAAEMSGWIGAPTGEGRARGFGFARYKNRAAYAAMVAEVEVDEEVRVTRVWAAVDAGLVINPDGAANQIEGGIIQATSWALKERVRFEGGRIASDTWGGYPILHFSEVPEVEIRFIERPDEPALGLGEASLGPTAAAIGNAVGRALGTRIRDLPLTRERIMATIIRDANIRPG